VTAISRTVLAFLSFSNLIFAQHLDFGLGFGVKGGVPFTDLLEATGVINQPNAAARKSGDYLIGPVVELRIPFGFAFEVNGLYRGTEYQFTGNNTVSTVHSQAWEIPYLAKFRFPIPILKPFISGGGAYRTFTELPSSLVITQTNHAFVLGGGLELRISRLRLSSEARWLHWNSPPNSQNGVQLGQNQGEVLFGIIF